MQRMQRTEADDWLWPLLEGMLEVNPPKLTCTTAATTNIRIARFDSSRDSDRYCDDVSSV